MNYSAGIGIQMLKRKPHKKLVLIVSALINFGLLGYFKYFNFFIESFVNAFSFLGMHIQTHSLQIILPVGISFFTFQAMGYVIDVYRSDFKAARNFISFSAFISFFPLLLSGPIERTGNLLNQVNVRCVFNYSYFSEGIKLMIAGFFMKLVLADRAAIYVDAVYNNAAQHQGFSFIAATLLFSFQIYGAFAGYSLIAIGTARLFGFSIINNFNRPYFSSSVTEFWRRWHISLSTWLRDYIYTPLVISWRNTGKIGISAAILITFIICGLWHGASITFIIWGGLNGIFLIFEALFMKKRRKNLLFVILTFSLINFSWIFFRANNLQDAFHIIKTIFTLPGKLYIPGGADVITPVYALAALIIVLLSEIKKEYFDHLFTFRNNKYELIRMIYFGIIIFLIVYTGVFNAGQFIYFQF